MSIRSRKTKLSALGVTGLASLLTLAGGCAASTSDGEPSGAAVEEGLIKGPIFIPPIGLPPVTPTVPEGCDAPRAITDWGYSNFRVYADVNGDHKDDYCRFVGDSPNVFLSCQLACPAPGYGISTGYSSIPGIDQGYAGTAFIRDLNDDGHGDFCRTVGNAPNTFIACDMGTANGFDPNQYGVSLPPNTPMIGVTLAPMPTGRFFQGQAIPFTMTITNNLPWVQAGYATAELVSATNPSVRYSAELPGFNSNVQPHESLTATVSLNAPSYGLYNAYGAYTQPFATYSTVTGESAAQPFKVTAPSAAPTVQLYPSGSNISDPGQTITLTQGSAFNVDYYVAPGPYCESSRYTIRYNADNGASTVIKSELTTSTVFTFVDFKPNSSGTVTLDATCESDVSLSSRSFVNVKVNAPPPPPLTHEAQFTTTLFRGAPANGGPLYYGGYVPGTNVYGNAHWLQNPVNNGTAISIVKAGETSESCFDANASVMLAPGAKTSAADMEKLFGSSSPGLPLAVVACVYSGGNPPTTIGVTIDYTYQ